MDQEIETYRSEWKEICCDNKVIINLSKIIQLLINFVER